MQRSQDEHNVHSESSQQEWSRPWSQDYDRAKNKAEAYHQKQCLTGGLGLNRRASAGTRWTTEATGTDGTL